LIISDDGRDKNVSQRFRLFGNATIDRENLIGSMKHKYNQHQLPDYNAMLKYNIITGIEEEDRLPALPSVRKSFEDPNANLVFKQREIDQIMRRMR